MKNVSNSLLRTLVPSCLAVCSLLPAAGQNAPTVVLTTEEAKGLCATVDMQRTSVHDPSIVYNESGKNYYIFGSHVAVAKTSDLQNWTWVNVPWGTVNDNGAVVSGVAAADAFHTNQTKKITIKGEEVTFGNFDAAGWNCSIPGKDDDGNVKPWTVDGDMWAPDVVYNPTMGKWCQYLSLNGPEWNSCIILLTADRIEGPYVYQGPVVYTGFRNDTDERISFHKTDLELVLGEQATLPSRYNKANWGDFWPHAIDPCVFYDEDGKLWMAYGSWSGGIYMLELNETTGLRDYDVEYGSDYDTKGQAVTCDPYFGKKIAGGYYVSGEGPYIEHIGNYYYLFMSYGGFKPDSGYEMRIFRSEAPDGPYVDAKGTDAIFSRWLLNYGLNSDTRGEKILGAYNRWGFMTVGECAQGHNSIIAAQDGRTYLVYHTKFNNGTDGHQVRVHQVFVNRQGWLVAAPFEYNGETVTDSQVASEQAFSKEEVAGTYHFMFHKYRMNHDAYEEMVPTDLTLAADGSVSGAYAGTWSLTEGTSYISLKLSNVEYDGVLVEQQMEPTKIKSICFTACNGSGVNVWGYKMEDKYKVAYSVASAQMPVKEGAVINSHVDLYGIGVEDGVTLKWTSDTPDLISNTGRYDPTGVTERTPVALTAEMSCGDYYWTETYNIIAREEENLGTDYLAGLKAYYGFDAMPYTNAYNTAQQAVLLSEGSNRKPASEEDSIRTGNVLHQYFGASGNCSYVRMPNPLRGEEIDGFTVSMWVKRTDDVPWDAVWSFYNAAANTRLYLTGNTYVGFNNGSDWFDINHPGTVLSENIPVGKWTLVTLTVSRSIGCTIYINGSAKTYNSYFVGNCKGAGITSKSDFDYDLVVDFIQSCPYFYLGYGSFWGTADVIIDDVMIYDNDLSRSTVRTLTAASNRVTDFAAGDEGNSIAPVRVSVQEGEEAIYDLAGRKVQRQGKGVYIVNGKKKVSR